MMILIFERYFKSLTFEHIEYMVRRKIKYLEEILNEQNVNFEHYCNFVSLYLIINNIFKKRFLFC